MNQQVEFYFDFQSPYSYLAHSQLGALGAPVRLTPFQVLPLMKLVNNTPTTITCSVKRAYASKDLGRWAARYAVPLSPPDMKRLDAELLLRVVTAAESETIRATATDAIFKAVWGGAGDPSAEGLEALLSARGLPGASLIAAAGEPWVADALVAATQAAAGRGVFGSPTIFVGDEMFFGNDRLDFVRELLATKAAA
ncbi:MAG: 2-hydroxychromene-2-carboxylate isomerase [Caulobacteraceae bacterium]